jgi:hypothetical protein
MQQKEDVAVSARDRGLVRKLTSIEQRKNKLIKIQSNGEDEWRYLCGNNNLLLRDHISAKIQANGACVQAYYKTVAHCICQLILLPSLFGIFDLCAL